MMYRKIRLEDISFIWTPHHVNKHTRFICEFLGFPALLSSRIKLHILMKNYKIFPVFTDVLKFTSSRLPREDHDPNSQGVAEMELDAYRNDLKQAHHELSPRNHRPLHGIDAIGSVFSTSVKLCQG